MREPRALRPPGSAAGLGGCLAWDLGQSTSLAAGAAGWFEGSRKSMRPQRASAAVAPRPACQARASWGCPVRPRSAIRLAAAPSRRPPRASVPERRGHSDTHRPGGSRGQGGHAGGAATGARLAPSFSRPPLSTPRAGAARCHLCSPSILRRGLPPFRLGWTSQGQGPHRTLQARS